MAEVPIGRAIGLLAEKDPGRPAISHEGTSINRRDLDSSTNRLARAYSSMGVKQNDLVTIALPNGIEFFKACIAAWKLGATPQPVSSRAPLQERQTIVDLADPPIVVGAEQGSHPGRTCLPAGYQPDGSLSEDPLPELVARSWKAPTSGGSTGRPKIILSGRAGLADPEHPVALGMQPDGVQLVPGPLYHNGPFNFSMQGLLSGSHLIVMSRFDASKALELIERRRVDWVLFVPTMMHRIWRLPESERLERDLSSLRVVLHLGAPCPAWLKQAWIDWLGPERIYELYAGTEAQGITVITGDEWVKHPGTVGKPTRPGSMKILDSDGNPLPPGEVGEIWMLPPQEKTYEYIGAEVRSLDGWESLGDMGWMDEEGYLYLADRRTDLILVGGANVYPAEVEAALEEHPLVHSAAVIGLPDEELGHRVHAILQVDRPVQDEELKAHVAERLARYKVPRSFEFVDRPLRDEAGKVRRWELRAERL